MTFLDELKRPWVQGVQSCDCQNFSNPEFLISDSDLLCVPKNETSAIMCRHDAGVTFRSVLENPVFPSNRVSWWVRYVRVFYVRACLAFEPEY